MASRVHCRLILPKTDDGATNMAIDEALLASCEAGESALTLRLYAWSKPTLSLGYFQEAPASDGALARLPAVRRLTGGGAIVHDAELTYSLVWPLAADLRIPAAAPEAYAHLNRALSAALRLMGVEPDSSSSGDTARAFLCFQRRSRYDLLVRGHKIVGSAQRRRHAAALQHGSVLIGPSDARGIPDLSLTQLLGRAVSMEEAANALVRAFETELGWTFVPGELTAAERRRVDDLCRQKYRRLDWGGRRKDRYAR
jgi:lipoate-protein ligase A